MYLIEIQHENYFQQNQVDFLDSKGIKAHSLNSKTGVKERDVIMKDLASTKPTIKLLYVTPEMCTQTYFQVTNSTQFIYFLVIQYIMNLR